MTETSTSSLWMCAGLFVATAIASQVLQHAMRMREAKKKEEEASFEEWRKGYERNRLGTGRMSYRDVDHLHLAEKRHEESRDSSPDLRQSNDNIYDFRPKNANWSHFELKDLGEEGDDDSEGTSSSDEAFLWMRTHRLSRSSHWTTKLRDSIGFGGESSYHGSVDTYYGSSDEGGEDVDAGWRNVSKGNLSFRRYQSAPTDFRENDLAPQVQNRAARQKYNSRIMPNKLVLLRHGQSMGNVNPTLYSTTPDNAMPITKLGWEQARKAGQVLKEQVLAKGESVHFVVSPYVRTVETFHGVVSAWCDPSEFKHIKDRNKRLKAWYARLLELGLTWHEDPRIREQDFGNYQNPELIEKSKQERHRFGIFFYRFPNGESASDVFDRVSTFLDSLWRSFDLNRSRNYVLITHGISIRVLLARYFRYTIAQFSMLANPKNCEMVIMRHDGLGRLRLDGRCELEVKEEEGQQRVTGYTFHERLRTVPSQYTRKVKFRMSYDDD